MTKFVPADYCSVPVRLVPFKSKKAAERWLKNNNLNTNNTPLLIPFYNETYKRIEFLKPTGDRLRVMGAANYFNDDRWSKKTWSWGKRIFSRDFVPHVENLQGDTIIIQETRVIIIYEKARKSVGQEFAKLFRSQREKIRKQIEAAQTNDAPRLEPAEVIQDLSNLGLNLEINAGMVYFIDEKDGVKNVYRHTFHGDGASSNLKLYLEKEAEESLSTPVRVYNHKTENNHFDSFLIDWIKGIFFATITAIGTGFVGSIFLPVFISAPIAVTSFITLSFYAFYKASKDNVKTMEFGKSEFKVVQPNAATTNMNSANDCQAKETPTMQRNSASVAQQCSELEVLKNRGQVLNGQTAMPMSSFFYSGLRSVSTLIKNPTETVATLVKVFELEHIVKSMVKST